MNMLWVCLGLAIGGGIIFVLALPSMNLIWMGIGIVMFIVGVIFGRASSSGG
jgi:hypothetical protein